MTGGNALLLVGGGRWARVYLSILAKLDFPFESILVASEHGDDRLTSALAQANALGRRRFTRLGNWQEVDDPGAAIVINAAREHARTSMALLDAGIPVLVEKPSAMGLEEARAMMACARAAKRLLKPALMLNYCEYLKIFSHAARQAIGAPATIEIQWADVAVESRYGESKSIDLGLGLADDVGPHIATILTAVGGEGRIDTVEVFRGGLAVALRGWCGEAALAIFLERGAPARQRVVVLRDAQGRKAKLDFTVEPGMIEIDGVEANADPGWSRRASPLTQQLQDFFRGRTGTSQESDLATILQTAEFSECAAGRVMAAQRTWLAGEGRTAAQSEKLTAVRELLAPHLAEAGLVRSGDNAALTKMAESVLAGTADGLLANCLAAAGISAAV